MFSKIFSKQSVLAMPPIYDITRPFKQTLNQHIRVIPAIDYLDLTIPPLNNINFWLKNANNLKKTE